MALKRFILFFSILTFVLSKPFNNLNDEDSCGYNSCPSTDPEKLNVHLVCHSHDDLGWLKTVDGYFQEDMISIFDSVIQQLLLNPKRKFVQTETSYFSYWWALQSDEVKENVRKLVNNGQFEIANGAWDSNDEASTHYQSIIDQFTLGHRFLEDELGKCARTNIGWQIDTFGHSREQASIYSQIGIDGFIFTRFHYEDLQKRKDEKTMDLLWISSDNLGVDKSNIFTSIIYNHYSHPGGFCFDKNCNDPEIVDDENDSNYNLEERVQTFAKYAEEQASHYSSNNILITMGDDFQYANASKNFGNIDKLISGFEKIQPKTSDGKVVNILYSSPACYTKSVNDYVIKNEAELNVKYDDFFPHAHVTNEYWTGYYTSRPTSKRYERIGNNILQVSKQLTGLANLSHNSSFKLEDAVAIIQHHDAMTGTEKEAVEKDYHLRISIGIEQALIDIPKSLSILLDDESFQELKYCPLLNSSVCSETNKDEFNVLLYNPLGRVITEQVQIPVDGDSWVVTGPNGSEITNFVTEPIREFSEVRDDLKVNLHKNILFFSAEVAALGYSVFNVKKVTGKSIEAKNVVTYKYDSSIVLGFEKNNVAINTDTGLVEQFTVQGISVNVTQEFYYYISDIQLSNPYIFRPDSDIRTAQKLSENVTFSYTSTEGSPVVEIKQHHNDWVVQIIRIFEDEDYIELDWAVGPIEINNEKGVEVISRFSTDLSSKGVFYTDSNSRELIKRENKKRPTYEYTDEEPQSGNYFPVTSRVFLEDESTGVEFSIITDRPQGAASLDDGQLELMVHRALLSTHPSIAEHLNEIEYNVGLVARGSYYITIGHSNKSKKSSDTKSAEATQRDIAQRKHLRPLVLFTTADLSPKSLSFLKQSLPENVHLLTLAKWNDSDDSYLLRLEHFFEKNDDVNLSKDAVVDLENLFDGFTITSAKETTLNGILPLEENNRLSWPQFKNFKRSSDIKDDGLKITLTPMQIRTFIVNVKRN